MDHTQNRLNIVKPAKWIMLSLCWCDAGDAGDVEAAAQALQVRGLQSRRKLSLASYHRQLLASCLSGKAKLLLRKAADSQHAGQLKKDALALQEEAATLLGTKQALQ